MIGTQSLTDLYVEVQHFHARQMQLLDGGDFPAYAATFTEDGEFTHTPQQPPARGRDGIVTELNRFHERFAEDPVIRRHWFNQLWLEPREDGSVQATYYALVVTTRPERNVTIAPSCVVRDVLVRDGEGNLLVRSRTVDHDRRA
ncbi:nuclear transport factor 2 family protein [Micromonospora maritima]|uniref:nuclear transport factor 2 family protein n=1 Tax=Micromonospora maritima TaxID=986711 RepID=UPI0037A02C17